MPFKLFFVAIGALLVLAAVPAPTSAGSACVDVETASAKQLQTLKSVGEKTATSIVQYRAKQRSAATKAGKSTWNFRNWATLMKVSGVSNSICAANVASVCFSGKVQKSCPKTK